MTAKLSKTQVDLLGNRLRKGLERSDLRLLDEYRRSFHWAYDTVIQVVRKHIGLRPTGRPAKSTGAIVEKLERESIRLSQMQDIAGCRIVVNDIAAQENAVDVLSKAFEDVSVVDRRVRPSHGYRAVHLVIRVSGKNVEIQIRTELQHVWAELSEKMSDTIDPAIKYGGGSRAARAILLRLSKKVAILEELEGRLTRDDVKRAHRIQPLMAKARDELLDTFSKFASILDKER